MPRPIDADALKKKAAMHGHAVRPLVTAYHMCVSVHDIDDAPTIEAEPVKHGCWVGTADGYADGELVYDMWECSECGYDADGADEKPNWKYCPNCGAKMDGGDTVD